MSLIGDFITGTYTVKRSCPGFFKEGIFQPGEVQCFEVSGSLQPLNAREIMLMPEGDRLKQYWKFFTYEKILPVKTGSDPALADTFLIDGEEYKAMSVLPWQGLRVDLPYYKAVLYRAGTNN